jgi:CheY-like chemotaxis protein
MSEKIFIVDDSKTENLYMRGLIEKDFPHIEFYCYTDPILALEKLKEHHPFLVILDYEMPMVDGQEFMIKLSEQLCFRDTSIVLCSGKSFSKNKVLGLQTLGITQVLKNPLSESVIVETINNLLSEKV